MLKITLMNANGEIIGTSEMALGEPAYEATLWAETDVPVPTLSPANFYRMRIVNG